MLCEHPLPSEKKPAACQSRPDSRERERSRDQLGSAHSMTSTGLCTQHGPAKPSSQAPGRVGARCINGADVRGGEDSGQTNWMGFWLKIGQSEASPVPWGGGRCGP